jgi:RHS repeat-associated protein
MRPDTRYVAKPPAGVKPSTRANGNVTRFSYDLLDRLAATTDAVGRVTTNVYDALGRPTQIINAVIQAAPLLQQAYSPNGRLASLTDANGNTTQFAYDGFDRLAITAYPLGSTETFTYDADSNVLTRKTRANQTITFTYDTLNRLATKTPPAPAPVVTYNYDLLGRLTGASDAGAAIVAAVPLGAPSVQYATNITYDALNRPTSVTFDPAPAVTPPASASAVSFGHSYNKANQRSGQTTTDNSWWSYPAATPSTVSYTADALNRYTQVGAVTPSYDSNGNLTSDGTYTLGYDAENRLVSASGAGNAASYAYDAQGRRKSKTVNGASTIFVTDADNREVLEYDGATGAVKNWYAYGLGPNDVLGQMNVAANTRATFIPDMLGSIAGVIDHDGGTLTRIGYAPYGTPSNSAGPFRFTGQRIDPETNGLHYYRARMYSAAWGRFLQTDPIGHAGGSNLYAYVGSDPLNSTDPEGILAFQLGGAAAGAVIGVAIQVGIDVWNLRPSSPSAYVGAAVGGAAGGVAATLCGTCGVIVAGSVSGAVGGGASNLVTGGLSGSLSVAGVATDTAIGAIGGAVAGHLLPAAFKSFVSNSTKGYIGELLSEVGLRLSGQGILESPAPNNIGRSTFDFLLSSGRFVESKFGTAQLTTAQREAAGLLGNQLEAHYWNYPTVSGIAGGGVGAASLWK